MISLVLTPPTLKHEFRRIVGMWDELMRISFNCSTIFTFQRIAMKILHSLECTMKAVPQKIRVNRTSGYLVAVHFRRTMAFRV